jgi:hypothetical protein
MHAWSGLSCRRRVNARTSHQFLLARTRQHATSKQGAERRAVEQREESHCARLSRFASAHCGFSLLRAAAGVRLCRRRNASHPRTLRDRLSRRYRARNATHLSSVAARRRAAPSVKCRAVRAGPSSPPTVSWGHVPRRSRHAGVCAPRVATTCSDWTSRWKLMPTTGPIDHDPLQVNA